LPPASLFTRSAIGAGSPLHDAESSAADTAESA
jgi:hypothetical protein